MPDTNDRFEQNEAEQEESEEERLLKRFPDLPPPPEIPNTPHVSVKLPPRPSEIERKSFVGGGYGKSALAFTAATSFILPPIGLGVAGWFLDQRLHTNWIAFVGVVLGMVAGITQLMQIVNRLNDEPGNKTKR